MGWSPCIISHLWRPKASGGGEKELGGGAVSVEQMRWSSWCLESFMGSWTRMAKTGGCPDKAAHDGPTVVADGGAERQRHQKRRKTSQVSAQSLGTTRGGRKTSCRSPEATDSMERLPVALFMAGGEKFKCGQLAATSAMRLGGGALGS
jgi:hypothetical protein